MTGKELYEKYAGRKAVDGRVHGVICGYGVEYLMIAVESKDPYDGWLTNSCADVICTHTNNENGYWYVEESDIID